MSNNSKLGANIPDPENLSQLVRPKKQFEPVTEERKKAMEETLNAMERCIVERRVEFALRQWALKAGEVKEWNAKNPDNPKPEPAKNASILSFGNDIGQGKNQTIYSFVRFNTKTQEFRFVNTRPKEHPKHIWFFGILNMALGGNQKHIGNRSLYHSSINLKPVMDRLRENEAFKNRYLFTLTNNRRGKQKFATKWFLKIHWQEDRDRIINFRQSRQQVKKISPPKKKPQVVSIKKRPVLGKPVGKPEIKVEAEAEAEPKVEPEAEPKVEVEAEADQSN